MQGCPIGHPFCFRLSPFFCAPITTNKQICQRSLVCAVSLLPHCLVFFFASGSEATAKVQRRHSGKTETELATSRPFSNAKIVRIYDIANFFEQKKSLSPLLKKRGSLWWQKRLSLVAGDTDSIVVGIVFKRQKTDSVYQNRVCTTAFLLHNAAFII